MVKSSTAVAISEYMASKLSGLREGMAGRVLSVHSELFNVVLSDNALLTVQSPSHIRTPMTLEVQGLTAEPLEPGLPVYKHLCPDRLVCGELAIVLSSAASFSSRAKVRPGRKRDDAEMILHRHFIENRARRSVFHYLQSDGVNGWAGDDAAELKYGEVLRHSALRLVTAVRDHDPTGAAEAAMGIVGLGPGMTPAGDDFLQGYFLFSKSFPKHHLIVETAIKFLREQPILETTTVSRALWGHFFEDRISDAGVKLVEAYNCGDWESFGVMADIIGRIGHSSGDDFLSGIWLALANC